MQQEALKETQAPTIVPTSSDPCSFDALLPEYLEYAEFELGYSPETLRTYKSSLKRLKMYTEQIDPRTFSQLDVLHLKAGMKGRGLSANYINATLASLRSFFAYCADTRRMTLAINYREIKKMKVPRRAVVFLTPDEVQRLIAVISEEGIRGLRMRALTELLLGSGLRISEALSLTREVNLETRIVQLIGKGSKERRVIVSQSAVVAVQKYLAARTDGHPSLFVTFGEHPKPLQRYDLSKSFRHYARLAGIEKDVHAHIMRHTFATTLKNRGAQITDIQELLGHSDIKTTAKYYLGSDIDSLKDSVDRYLRY